MGRYQRPMIKLIARMTGDWALAEDLAQEAFVKAFRRLSAFDTTRRLSSWLLRIAHNTAIDALRRARPATVEFDESRGDAAPEICASPADAVESAALGQAIEAALDALRPDHRVAVMLRYEEGLPFEEIGHVLGIPEATARSHVHRARKALARQLTASGWAPSR